MIPPALRPLSIPEILDRTIRLYRTHFRQFTLAAMTIVGPLILLDLLQGISPIARSILALPLAMVLSPIVSAALASLAIQAYSSGEPQVREALRLGWRRWWPTFGALLRIGLVVAVPITIVAIIVAALSTGPRILAAVAILVGVLVALPVVVLVAAKYSVTIPALIAEELRSGPALTRSWKLTDGSFWRVVLAYLAFTLLTFFILLIPSIALAVVIAILGVLVGSAGGSPGTDIPVVLRLAQVISAILSDLGQLITLPVSAIIAVVLYYDLRVRKEGFALEQAIGQLAEEPGEAQP